MEVRSTRRPSRPQSVQELVSQAENFNFNINIPLKHWIRAAETLYQEAAFALSDGDYGRAYMMLYRHSILVLDKLRKHPQYKDPKSRLDVQELSKRMKAVIADLEKIKPIIRDEYSEWERMAPKELKALKPNQSRQASSYGDFAARDPSVTGNATVLDAAENQDLAVELAQKELTRRDNARHANRHAKVYGRTILSPHLGAGPGIDVDLQSQMDAARRGFTSYQDQAQENGREAATRRREDTARVYTYPSISRSKPVLLRELPPERPAESRLTPPMRPPKEYTEHTSAVTLQDASYTHRDAPPAIPRKIPEPESVHPPFHNTYNQPPLPPKSPIESSSRSRKERLAFKPGAYLENGDPIRSIFLPRRLRAAFLDIASDNTRRGLEMCGILCGTPVNNALFVRCLLIPDQKCTSDTCETENESAIFDFCAGEDLMVLGWIHTHPTQTCFMSSRDLHTHAGYQVMMPESIAIVCAPKFNPSYGIFRLTHPPGLDHILECRQSETFHQHSIGNLYRETEHPNGHVYESDKMPFDIKDLRSR